MSKNEQKELTEKTKMANEVANLMPETIHKVDYYKSLLKADSELIDTLEKRQSSFFISKVTKVREKVELIKVGNALHSRQEVFENYLKRKSKYQNWLDEMAREVQLNFDKIFKEAKSIIGNPRLLDTIKRWEEQEEKPTIQTKVEFYLFLKQEILNKRNGKK